MGYQCSKCKNNYRRQCMAGEPDCPRATDCPSFDSIYMTPAPPEADDDNEWEDKYAYE